MDIEKLLEALGAKDLADAYRIVAETNQFVADLREVTGQETIDGMLASVRDAVPANRELKAITGKGSAESVGIVLGWKSAADQLPKRDERVAELEEQLRRRDVGDLIKQGIASGQLTPATAKLMEGYSVEQLKAFLAVAPRVIPGKAEQPARASDVGATPPPAAVLADGRKFEDLAPAEQSALLKSDPDLYKALRDDWEQRGKPRRAQQRAAN